VKIACGCEMEQIGQRLSSSLERSCQKPL